MIRALGLLVGLVALVCVQAWVERRIEAQHQRDVREYIEP